MLFHRLGWAASAHSAPLRHIALRPLALAASVFCALLGPATSTADTVAPTQAPALPTVSVSAPAPRAQRATIAGLGELPGWQSPVQATTWGQQALRDAQVTRLADLTKLDASITDGYNPTGYWDSLNVRGFALSNAYNVRREGLPISAETRLPLDNKAAVEVLRGTSGIQAGVSSPAGLLNLLVKRPTASVRELQLGLNDRGGWLAGVDLSERVGQAREFGVRINAASESLRPMLQAADGRRRLLALATDWRLNPDNLLEAEVEHSHQRQPSQPGFSLLGDATLPSAKATDPTHNLNAQAWSLPVVLQGNTGSLRWTRLWAGGWKSQLSYGEQHLQSSDRAAFPSGCGSESNYTRYCSDGSFDLYDFRSEGEHRRTRAWLGQLSGAVQTGAVRHGLNLSLLSAQHRTDLQTAAFNGVGSGQVGAAFALAPNATPGYANTDRDERSQELSVVDALSHDGPWRAWVGLRHTRLKRHTELTDGSSSASLRQSLNTGWGALGYQLAPQAQVHLSWGQGVETYAAQNTPSTSYVNAGAVLPAQRSRQLELGLKSQGDTMAWGVNAFQVHRPVAGAVTGASGAAFLNDGQAVHKGLEAQWHLSLPQWQVAATAMRLDTERRGSVNSQINGQPAVNVPEHSVKASVAWRLPAPLVHPTPVWLQADVVHEGPRAVTETNTVRLPSWTRTDLSLRAAQQMAGSTVVWRVGVFNLFNLRQWREAPNYAGHVYLYPQAARQVSASATVTF